MNLKIAIHYYEGDFSDRWIDYCKANNIKYELVNCYSNDIIEKMKSFDVLLWSWSLSHYESLHFAKELIYSIEKMGKKVFPNFKTCYFYDNKLGQKYILESIDSPFIKTEVFFNKENALKWVNNSSFPKVFKLSGGAGAMNVKLCYKRNDAIKLIHKAFTTGFSPVDRITWFKDRVKRFKEKPSINTFKNLIKSFGRLFIKTDKEKSISNEKGYVYFQEFLPNNNHDLRIIVIFGKAFAIKRLCRKGDFRASGSGNIIFDKNEIDVECVKIAHQTTKKLDVQCIAYDFVYDKDNKPKIIEISYHFAPYSYDNCEGYWDENLNWHNEKINPQEMIIKELLQGLN